MTKATFQAAQEVAQLINQIESVEVEIAETNTSIKVELYRLTRELKDKININDFMETLKAQLQDYLKTKKALLDKEFEKIGESEVQNGN